MADLTFVDSHNMVAYLEKSEDNDDFAEIVDFLNASPIKYALTVSLTIYVSYIEHFWSTAKIKTVNNKTQIRAKVNGKTIVITESFVRRDLHFDDEDAVFNDEYDTPSHTKKVFANMIRQGKDFSGTVTPLFATMLIQSQAVEGEGSEQPTESQHPHVEPIPTVASSAYPKKTQKHRKTKRKATKISQSSRPTTLVADETVYKERGDSVERAATTPTSLDAKQGSGNINRTQSTKIPNDPFPQGIGLGGIPRRQDTILGDRPAQTRVLALENIKTAQDLEITNLKKRVKKLEKKKKSRTLQLKRRLLKFRLESSAKKSLGDQEDASKQEGMKLTKMKGFHGFKRMQRLRGVNTLGSEEDSMKLHELMDLCTKLSERVLALENIKTAQDLEITNLKKRVKKLEKKKKSRTPQLKRSHIRPFDNSNNDDITLAETLMKIKSIASRSQKDKGDMFKEPSEPTTTSKPQSQIPAKDKGKGIMQEPEKPVKVKGKDQIEYDADVAQRLQEELDEEVRLEREIEEEASKAANIVEWDDVQAMMDADYELAAKLQVEEQGEIYIEERSRLFMELMDKRKKHFEKLRAEKKPPTKTQKRNIMSTYLKNVAGYKHTQLKNKSFEEIQMLFEKEMKRVNIFADMDAELVKGKEIREESSFQIHRAGRQGSYEIIRANGNTKTYTLFSQLIKEFDREDLENLWKLVKTKHGYTRPEEAYERVLWGDLKVMFEPDVEDNIWRNLQGQKILLWKLYDSCIIHFVRFENMHIYMLVEKRYPLLPTTITDMLNRKLQADYWDETCYQLLKLITKQLKNP
ncbi:hypothetical protein Tco_1103419 [Tanacetum coccineum]